MTQNNMLEQTLSALIKFAGSILKLTSDEMREAFPEHNIKTIEYIKKGKPDEITEIRLNEECTTLSCEFDSLGYCIAVYIFFDYAEDIHYYKDYFNKKYKHNWFRKRWKTEKCFLSIKNPDGVLYIKCY